MMLIMIMIATMRQACVIALLPLLVILAAMSVSAFSVEDVWSWKMIYKYNGSSRLGSAPCGLSGISFWNTTHGVAVACESILATMDGGESWTTSSAPIHGASYQQNLGDVVALPNGHVVAAGTNFKPVPDQGNGYIAVTGKDYLQQSTDKVNTLKFGPEGLFGVVVTRKVRPFTHNDKYKHGFVLTGNYADYQSSMMVSYNGTQLDKEISWGNLNYQEYFVQDSYFSQDEDTILAVGGGNEHAIIMRVTHNAMSMVTVLDESGFVLTGVVCISNETSCVAVGTSTQTCSPVIWRSTDLGLTWKQINVPSVKPSFARESDCSGSILNDIESLQGASVITAGAFLSQSASGVVYSSVVLTSEDGGVSWQQSSIMDGVDHIMVNDLSFVQEQGEVGFAVASTDATVTDVQGYVFHGISTMSN